MGEAPGPMCTRWLSSLGQLSTEAEPKAYTQLASLSAICAYRGSDYRWELRLDRCELGGCLHSGSV